MNIRCISDLEKRYDLLVKWVSLAEFGQCPDLVRQTARTVGWTTASVEPLFIGTEKTLFIGAEGNEGNLSRAAGRLVNILDEKGVKAIIIDAGRQAGLVEGFLEAVAKAAYSFDKYKTANHGGDLREFSFLVSDAKLREHLVRHTLPLVDAVTTTRDLSNEPGNRLTTDLLVHFLENDTPASLQLEILDRDTLSRIGAGLITAVGAGSPFPPYMAILSYLGNPASRGCDVALVGKGLCFDSGGLCLKSRKGMGEMKHDMTGAATLVGVMQYLAASDLPLNVVGILGIAENAPGNGAYRPGDVLRSYSGKNVEVIDTDAEGRLVLADCISYVKKRFSPKIIIDVATLTGSVKQALGSSYAGLFSNDPDLAASLLDSGKASGEALWELPLGEEYASLNRSTIADIANVGNHHGTVTSVGGASSAAEFLRFFAEETRWAHLDIAGTAYNEKGATGFGVKLLVEWLRRS